MLRFFLDANVVFSAAHNPNGNSRALFELARVGRIALVVSRYAVEEATRNVALKYPDCVVTLETLLGRLDPSPEPLAGDVAVAMDLGVPAKDAPILAAAIAVGADVLVTGDRRHFGALFGERVQGVVVLPPADAVELALRD